MRRSLTITATMLSVFCLSVAVSIGSGDDPVAAVGQLASEGKPEISAVENDQTDRQKRISEREAAFTKLLTGCVLVGQFTIDGKPLSPKPERYEIRSIKKLDGRDWLITARVKYGQIDGNFPMKIPVEWADDETPVMILDNLTIPLLGTFGGRVMFHGDRYVATWQHGKVCGHMFGKIERAKPDKPKPADGERSE